MDFRVQHSGRLEFRREVWYDKGHDMMKWDGEAYGDGNGKSAVYGVRGTAAV